MKKSMMITYMVIFTLFFIASLVLAFSLDPAGEDWGGKKLLLWDCFIMGFGSLVGLIKMVLNYRRLTP